MANQVITKEDIKQVIDTEGMYIASLVRSNWKDSHTGAMAIMGSVVYTIGQHDRGLPELLVLGGIPDMDPSEAPMYITQRLNQLGGYLKDIANNWDQFSTEVDKETCRHGDFFFDLGRPPETVKMAALRFACPLLVEYYGSLNVDLIVVIPQDIVINKTDNTTLQ